MQLVQDIASGDTLTRKQGITVTESSIYKQVNGLDAGLNRVSERQQLLLLLLVGYAFMGLVVTSVILITLPTPPAAGAVKAVPDQVNKPAAYSRGSNQPMVKAVKI
jgi:hypothetical protein